MRIVEPLDVAAVHARRERRLAGSPAFSAELASRATAIALGQPPKRLRGGVSSRELQAALERAERRVGRVPAGLGVTTALDFLGEAVAAAAADDLFGPGEARAAVAAAAEAMQAPARAVAFAVFRRALASTECTRLAPMAAAELTLALLVELAPAAAASLWAADADGALGCLVGNGTASQSRGLREVARAALDGANGSTAQIRVQIVDRWGRPYAALVARGRASDGADLVAYLQEAAGAFAPLLERAAEVDRELEGARQIVAGGERRLVRLAFDLHDGPLQDVVALADELRLAAEQIEPLVGAADQPRVRGRFDDLHARLAALDEGLREIAFTTSSIAPLARPVAEAVMGELESVEGAGIATELDLDGDLDELTDSQKIVLFRVVQEALANVRKHSGARTVSVALRSTGTDLDLTVRDDGHGFDTNRHAGKRLGLAGIAERVRLLGGSVDVESRPGGGTTVRATLPRWRPSTAAAS